MFKPGDYIASVKYPDRTGRIHAIGQNFIWIEWENDHSSIYYPLYPGEFRLLSPAEVTLRLLTEEQTDV